MKFFFFMMSLTALKGFAQTTNYTDVGVIVNLNSPVSMQIGSYFQQARNIPNQNMIYVSVPTTEVINDTEFNQLRTQIENYLVTPRIMKRTLSVPGAVTIISALIGTSLLGLIGGLLAVPVAASIILILDEVVFPRADNS